MREWLLMLLPVGVIVYFIVYPDQFSEFMTWASGLIH
jgi:hypothetical protein